MLPRPFPHRRLPLPRPSSPLTWIDPNSLQVQMTVGVVLVSLLAIGGMTSWLGWRTQSIVLNSHREQARMLADRFGQDVRHYGTMMPLEMALQKVIDHRTTGDLAIWVTTAEGEILGQSETLNMGSWQVTGVATALQRLAIAEGIAIRPVQDWVFVLCTEPFALGEISTTLHLAHDITTEYRGLRQMIQLLWLTGLAIMTLLAVACAFYIQRTLRPIRHLNQLASQVTAETLGQQTMGLPPAPTEITDLAQTYNLMLTRLAKAWRQQKQLINDISHELRTPLSLVQGYLESTLRRGQNLTPPQRQGLEVAAAETSRTIHLLGELLELARLENGQQPLDLVPTALVEVVQAAIAGAAEQGSTPGETPARIHFESIAPSPVVRVDPAKLRLVLRELLDNARRYSSPDQGIQVRLGVQTRWAVVQVEDQGVGIPQGCETAVFDPFYRVDDTRSRHSGGTGLGLTLVRSWVEAMAGEVTVRSQPSQGSVFTIRLPL